MKISLSRSIQKLRKFINTGMFSHGNHLHKDKKGEVTVFLAMILVMLMTLLLVMAESARTAGERLYLRMAVDSSMDSLMAQYHRKLWQKYRILGLEADSKGLLEEELKAFLDPYMQAENWYPLKTEEAVVKDMAALTEGKGSCMEREILEYMKYGLVGVSWDAMTEGEAKEALEGIKNASGVNHVSGLYEEHCKEAVALEKALEKLNGKLEQQKMDWEAGISCLKSLDGRGMVKKCRSVIKSLQAVPALVEAYEKQADRLERALSESRENFETEEDLEGNSRQLLNEQIRSYETYISQDGERRGQIRSLTERSRENISFMEGLIKEAEDVIRYIDDWEPSDEEDELDEEELWEPVIRHMTGYPVLALDVSFGVRDKEKEGWLERIRSLTGKGILKLVLPEDSKISGGKPDLSQAPSTLSGRGTEHFNGVSGLVDRLLVAEYGVRYFPHFQKKMENGDIYEMEYVLYGKKTDKENLEASVLRLVTVRQGLNLIHILSDGQKRQEAEALAASITGGMGLLPLTAVVTFFVMGMWALAEAFVDVRCLLNGGKVPLVKAVSDWQLSLEGVLKIGAEGKLPDLGENITVWGNETADESRSGSKKGLDLTGYLRMFLFVSYGSEPLFRMMDMMQMNIRKEQPDFLLEKCVCMVDAEAGFCGKPVFFSSGPWKTLRKTRFSVSGNYFTKP